MEYDYKKIEDRMKSLPKDLQRAMASIETANIIQDIAEKYKLTVDQTGQLFDLTGYIMLGFIPSAKFVSELTKQLDVSKDIANQIVNDVNSDVFGSIRTSLQKIQEDENSLEKITPASNTASTKESVLNIIENPTSSVVSNAPINLLSEEYPMVIPGQKSEPTRQTSPSPSIPPAVSASVAPAKPNPSPSLNLMDRFMSAPVSAKNETVEKKVGEIKPPDAPKARIPGTPDPYRESIE